MSVRNQPLDGPCGAVSRALEVSVPRRQSTGYEHKRGRVQCRCLLDGLAVIGLRSLCLCPIRGREESASAQRRDAQARLGYQPTGLVESDLSELFPPDPDRAEA